MCRQMYLVFDLLSLLVVCIKAKRGYLEIAIRLVYMLERFNQCSISTVNPSNKISLLSANCRGLNNKEKRYDVLNYI